MTRLVCDGKSIRPFWCLMALAICSPAVAKDNSFAGPYAGVSLGYGGSSVREGSAVWSQAGFIDFLGTRGENSKSSGAIGGLNLGYDWRFNKVTLGIDLSGVFTDAHADGTMLSFDETIGVPSNPVASRTKVKTIVAIKPRLGLILDARTKLYGMAGVATAEVSRTITGMPGPSGDLFLDPGVSASDSRRMTGYTLGLGAERLISRRFSVTLEFNYVDFGSQEFTYGGTTFGVPSSMVQSVKVTNSSAALGLVYRF